MENNALNPAPPVTPEAGVARLSSPGELFKKSWNNYQANLKNYLTLMLIPIVGMLVFYIFSFFSEGPEKSTNLPLFPIMLAFMVVFWYLMLRAFTALLILIRDDDPSKEAKSALRDSKNLVWSYLLVSVLVGLYVLAWALLFIIPGIIFSVYYGFAYWALIMEKQKGRAALKRSKELVKGYWWAVVGRGLYLLLLYLILFFVASMPAIAFPEGSMVGLIYSYFLNVIQYVVMPISFIYTYYIYKELKQIKSTTEIPK